MIQVIYFFCKNQAKVREKLCSYRNTVIIRTRLRKSNDGLSAVKNIEEVVNNLNMIGKQVNDWCQENQLTIHTGKSEVLIITNRDFVRPLRQVRIGSEIIQYVKTTSLLGIEVDNKLTWNTQVKQVIKSYSAKVGQLKRMAYLPIHVQEERTGSPAHTEDLERIHVRAARVIHRLPRDIPGDEILRLAKWDRLDYIYI